MRLFRLVLALGVLAVLLYTRHQSGQGGSGTTWSQEASSLSGTGNQAIPDKALRVLETVRSTGHAPEGYVGGRVFQNREGRLPRDGDYREFDVDPHQGGRNAERIIVEWNTKKAWYTGDHYQTFLPLP